MPFRPVVLVHGGAWAIPESLWSRSRAGVAAAAAAGHEALLHGKGTALDAVEAAVRVLEDDSAFDAGTGSVLNEDAQVEMDAVVMDGRTLRAGSVAAVQNVRNPVSLARLVMEKTDHVLLVGAGANKFAAKQGILEVLPEELVTAEAREQFEAIQQYQPGVDWLFRQQQQAHDTVGAVAMDADGHVAAATSTGGITCKMAGRVGDSPLLGAGAFADDAMGAASTTGHGESIMKTLLAFRVLQAASLLSSSSSSSSFSSSLAPPSEEDEERMLSALRNGIKISEKQNISSSNNSNNNAMAAACHDELRAMFDRVGGCGGVVAISRDGTPGLFHTTEKMPWALAGGTLGAGEVRSGMDASEAPPDLSVAVIRK